MEVEERKNGKRIEGWTESPIDENKEIRMWMSTDDIVNTMKIILIEVGLAETNSKMYEWKEILK